MTLSSVNTIWVLLGAAMVFFMQAGFSLCEAGFTKKTIEEHRQHPDEESDGLLHWHAMLLAVRLRHYVRRGKRGRGLAGSRHHQGLQLYYPGRRSSVGVSHFPDRILRDLCHHRFRLHGRAYQVQRVLHLFCLYFSVYLPHLRALDLGRRLAESAGLP